MYERWDHKHWAGFRPVGGRDAQRYIRDSITLWWKFSRNGHHWPFQTYTFMSSYHEDTLFLSCLPLGINLICICDFLSCRLRMWPFTNASTTAFSLNKFVDINNTALRVPAKYGSQPCSTVLARVLCISIEYVLVWASTLDVQYYVATWVLVTDIEPISHSLSYCFDLYLY